MSESNYRSRSKLHNKPRKKKSWGCLISFIILGILLLVGGAVFGYFYNRIHQTTESIQQSRPEDQIQVREESIDLIEEQEAFSILLLGVDTASLGREDTGRSDIVVFVTVNPNTRNMTLTSIPRDTLTEIVGLGEQDKINHAYAFGGVSMASNTVQQLLDVPVDYTISANMQGFSDIIDALGGITITPIDSFDQDGYRFVQGQTITLDGPMALAYTRNRYDTGGDYSRQERARQLVNAIIDKAVSIDSLWNLPSILSALEGNVLTDLTLDDIQNIALNYRTAIGNVETIQLNGTSELIDGIYYEIIDESSLESVRNKLKEELNYNGIE